MTIRMPEDIEKAELELKVMKARTAEFEKRIENAKRSLEQEKLKDQIYEAIDKVINNQVNIPVRIPITISDNFEYSFCLSKSIAHIYLNASYRKNSLENWNDVCYDTISLVYGQKLITHVISSLIFKRIALIRREIKKNESQDTAECKSKEGNRHGDSETAG